MLTQTGLRRASSPANGPAYSGKSKILQRSESLQRSTTMKRKKKGATPKSRNWIAVRATLRGGAGRHKDKKKEASRKACRGAQKGRPFSYGI